MRKHNRVYGAAALAGICVLLAACEENKAPPEISKGLENVKREMVEGRSEVQAVTESLKKLRDSKPAEIKGNVDGFAAALEKLENTASGVGSAVDTSAGQTEQYFRNWDRQMDAIEDQDLRQANEVRRQKVADAYRDIRAREAQLRLVFRPYMSGLLALKSTLAGNPTPATLESVKPTIEQAIGAEQNILERINDIVKQIDALSSY